ncbi:MIPT3 protein, partial [Grallaria varia]|nr:MIPT3 protein [Grallaria varia]
MDEAVARRTRDTLGQVIRKPPLTDALLSKPPFRYLHDLIGEVIRVTGFLKGLYTDFELKSDNVKDKDSKMSFLQKAIDVVVMVTGEPLAVKPARVVAGHEPEKTNEFLQAIGKCCLNKLSSDAAVKRVLAGERADAKGKPPSSKPREKEGKESRPEEPKGHRDKEGGRGSDVKESRDGKPKEGREREKEQKGSKERHRERHGDASGAGEERERERSQTRTAKQGREGEKSRGKGDGEEDAEREKGRERGRRHDGGRERDRGKGRDKEKGRDREGDKDRERGRDRARARAKEKEEEEEEEERSREHGREKAESKHGSPARISRQPSTRGSRQRSGPGGEGGQGGDIGIPVKCAGVGGVGMERSGAAGIPEDAGAENQEKSDPGAAERQTEDPWDFSKCFPLFSRSLGAVPKFWLEFLDSSCLAWRIPRPGSARPAPPRVKRQDSAELLLPERSGSAKTVPNVILDQQVPEEEEEEEQFVVEAPEPRPRVRTIRWDRKSKYCFFHGGLVQRILETKKDYEASQKTSQATDGEKAVGSGASRTRERDLVAKEIEKSQVSIQTLSQNALALGRIVDYIQEDMDAMRNELETWRQEKRQHEEALRREQSVTDGALEPLRAELAELEQLTRDQQDKIRALKANILKNDDKIQRMVLGVNLAARK